MTVVARSSKNKVKNHRSEGDDTHDKTHQTSTNNPFKNKEEDGDHEEEEES